MKRFIGSTLLFLLLISCGGESQTPAPAENIPLPDESNQADTAEETTEDIAEDTEANDPGEASDIHTAAAIKLTDYLGSLYQTFDWSGAVRDPMRDELEIQNANTYVAINDEDKSELNSLATEREIIAQIGGMGSAKIAPGATQPSDQFSAYMDAIIADNGEQWRSVVQSRATEVAMALPEGAQFYWQIGNEVNAASYTLNSVLYFNNETEGLSNEAFGMKVYVEYFLAPTIQGFMDSEVSTGKDNRIALGSVSAFSAPSSQTFLNDLLNYEISGSYAPALAGHKVHELIDLITIHYLAHAHSETNPTHWRDVLQSVYDTWVKDNITGVWTTEEVGINLAQGGLGAGAAITVAGRYLEWISNNKFTPAQSKWFNFGTNAGSTGQRISDATNQIYTLIGGTAKEVAEEESDETTLTHLHTSYYDSSYEVRSFGIGDPSSTEGIILLISGLADSESQVTALTLDGDSLGYLSHGQVSFARRYGQNTTDDISITAALSNDQLTLNFGDTALGRLESLIVVIQ